MLADDNANNNTGMDMSNTVCDVAVIGAGPAGLAAAEHAANAGLRVIIFEHMPTPARKFLMAGKSGLNITHSEPYETFISNYGSAAAKLKPALDHMTPEDIQNWMKSLGIEPFTGSSGRVFPVGMKASPLLRNWLKLLNNQDAKLHTRHKWAGWDNQGNLRFNTPEGRQSYSTRCTILALGGASWSKLGADGKWSTLLNAKGIETSPFQPANCGFNVEWSNHFKNRFAGAPVKNVATMIGGRTKQGEFVITADGMEGSLVYAACAPLRNTLAKTSKSHFLVDLTPQLSQAVVMQRLGKLRGKRSLSTHIKKQVGLDGVKLGLLYEFNDKETMLDPGRLAATIKALAVPIASMRPLDEAISVAGGVRFSDLDGNLMIKSMPGVFCAGEMIDWEAPTGGYLITGCMAQGQQAACGAVNWLNKTGEHA